MPTLVSELNPDWRALPIWVLEFMLAEYPQWQATFVGWHRVNQNAYDLKFSTWPQLPPVRVKRSEANKLFKQRTGK